MAAGGVARYREPLTNTIPAEFSAITSWAARWVYGNTRLHGATRAALDAPLPRLRQRRCAKAAPLTPRGAPRHDRGRGIAAARSAAGREASPSTATKASRHHHTYHWTQRELFIASCARLAPQGLWRLSMVMLNCTIQSAHAVPLASAKRPPTRGARMRRSSARRGWAWAGR